MSRHRLILALLVLLAGCARTESNEDAIIRRVFLAEYRLQGAYYTQDINQAKRSLEEYLAELRKIELPSGVSEASEMYHRNRALALVRLEFLTASQTHRDVDLTGAVSEMRKVNSQYDHLSDEKLAVPLVGLVRGDASVVPWLKDFETLSSRAIASLSPGQVPETHFAPSGMSSPNNSPEATPGQRPPAEPSPSSGAPHL